MKDYLNYEIKSSQGETSPIKRCSRVLPAGTMQKGVLKNTLQIKSIN